jgi:aspartate aminotransferase
VSGASGQALETINLRLGEPGLPTPPAAIAAATEAMAAGLTRYTHAAGLPELRAAVAEKFRRQGIDAATERTIVGAGGKSLLHALLLGDELAGREVIIPAPYYAGYPTLVCHAGGTPRILPTRARDGYKLVPADLRAALGQRTRWVLLNTPNNPTGATYSPDEVRALAQELAPYPDVLVLSDEIYEQFTYEAPAFSTAALSDDLARRTVTLDGVSKSYSMTGWRIGYATGPQTVIDRAIAAQFSIITCPPSVSQAAALAALTMPQAAVRARNAAFVELRDLAVEILRRSPALDVASPPGAFYLFPRITVGLDESRVIRALAERAAVIVAAGSGFGAPGHFRISFALDRSTLTEACRRIVATLDEITTEGVTETATKRLV